MNDTCGKCEVNLSNKLYLVQWMHGWMDGWMDEPEGGTWNDG